MRVGEQSCFNAPTNATSWLSSRSYGIPEWVSFNLVDVLSASHWFQIALFKSAMSFECEIASQQAAGGANTILLHIGCLFGNTLSFLLGARYAKPTSHHS